MRESVDRCAWKLVVFNGRGRVLGTVIVDDDEQEHRGVRNDCSAAVHSRESITRVVDWIENHDHNDDGMTLPSVSVERDGYYAISTALSEVTR